ncbi:MAG: RNA polymerase sigma factor [Planctomycetota bacterium]
MFETHRHDVYRWAYRLLGRHDDALDAAQDVFLQFCRRPADDPPRHPRAWLRRVTVNRSIDLLRRRRDSAAAPANVAATPPATAGRDDLRAAVGRALARLTDAQRDVVIAKVHDDLTFAEIAAEQGLAVPTVKTHYLRALRTLRAALADHGPDA